MSFVTTNPEALTMAAGQLQTIGSAMAAENTAVAAPTTGVVPAAADEVSALQATLFDAYGRLYQQISAQATAIHELFVHTLRTSADSYGSTEAANSIAANSTTGAGLTGLTGLTGTSAGTDPSFGLAGALSNSGVLAAMNGGNIGSAASEFTGLGKGFITAGPGVLSGATRPDVSVLASEVAPAAAPASGAMPVSAGVGQASSVGGLSVPASWAGATPAAAVAPPTPAGAGWTATSQPAPAAPTTVPAGMPSAASTGRGGIGLGTPRYGVKPIVMPRPAVV